MPEDVKSYLAVNYRGWGELSCSLLAADKRDFSGDFPAVLNFCNTGCTQAGQGRIQQGGTRRWGLRKPRAAPLGMALVAAGCRQQEEGPGVDPGVSAGRKILCFCHFARLAIQQTVPLGRREGVGLYQAGVRAQRPAGLPGGTGAVRPPRYPLSSHARPPVRLRSQRTVSTHGQPCGIQRLSASAVSAGGPSRCFISGAAAYPVPSRFPGWPWCPPGPGAQANLAVGCSTSRRFCFPPRLLADRDGLMPKVAPTSVSSLLCWLSLCIACSVPKRGAWSRGWGGCSALTSSPLV